VFLGFVAENWREHIVEQNRGKEYVHSFREDLAKDTAILQNGIGMLTKYTAAGDSLSAMIREGRTKSAEEIKRLYQYNFPALGGFMVPLTDRTAAQLKNSGGMRLIANEKISYAIVDYWKGSEYLNILFGDINDYRIKAREKSYLLFDNKYYSIETINGERAVLDGAQLMTNDYTTVTNSGIV
jgi:hypothetical protein